jgi:iron(III) transport system substrate-binding protein
MIKILIFSLLVMSSITAIAAISDSVTVYSSRKEHLIKPLFDAFTKDTGIKVSYLTGKGGALIERLKLEFSRTIHSNRIANRCNCSNTACY